MSSTLSFPTTTKNGEKGSTTLSPNIAPNQSSATLIEDVDFEEAYTWPRNPRAYGALIGCFLLMFNSWGLVNAYGTFSAYYSGTLLKDSNFLLLNLIGSTQSFFVLAFSFVVGRLLDAGYSRYLIGTGTALVSLGTFTLTKTASWDQNGNHVGSYPLIWLTQGLTTGLGMACFFVSSSQSE
jgi:MCP family monocarboxylic acid transporter-like MFS transporter 10